MSAYRPRFADACRSDDSRTIVETPGSEEFDVVDPKLAAALGDGVRVIKQNRGVFDIAPVSLISAATVRAISHAAEVAPDLRRFRPNIVVDVGDEPYEEDAWVGQTLRIGEAAIRVDQRDKRCVMVDVDPETCRRRLVCCEPSLGNAGRASVSTARPSLRAGSGSATRCSSVDEASTGHSTSTRVGARQGRRRDRGLLSLPPASSLPPSRHSQVQNGRHPERHCLRLDASVSWPRARRSRWTTGAERRWRARTRLLRPGESGRPRVRGGCLRGSPMRGLAAMIETLASTRERARRPPPPALLPSDEQRKRTSRLLLLDWSSSDMRPRQCPLAAELDESEQSPGAVGANVLAALFNGCGALGPYAGHAWLRTTNGRADQPRADACFHRAEARVSHGATRAAPRPTQASGSSDRRRLLSREPIARDERAIAAQFRGCQAVALKCVPDRSG